MTVFRLFRRKPVPPPAPPRPVVVLSGARAAAALALGARAGRIVIHIKAPRPKGGDFMLTPEQLEEGVDEDGTVDSYQGVHTDYAPAEAAANRVFDDGDGYVSVIADYQDRFIETRIAFDTLKRLGWRREGEP